MYGHEPYNALHAAARSGGFLILRLAHEVRDPTLCDTSLDGGGKSPIYCDLINQATGKFAHTSLTAAREQARVEKAGAAARPADAVVEAPASASRSRAESLLDRFRATAVRQAAEDATCRVDEAREELRQARSEHREDLTKLRTELRQEAPRRAGGRTPAPRRRPRCRPSRAPPRGGGASAGADPRCA